MTEQNNLSDRELMKLLPFYVNLTLDQSEQTSVENYLERSEEAVRMLLLGYALTIKSGPSALGVYQLTFASGTSEKTLKVAAEELRQRSDVIDSVAGRKNWCANVENGCCSYRHILLPFS